VYRRPRIYNGQLDRTFGRVLGLKKPGLICLGVATRVSPFEDNVSPSMVSFNPFAASRAPEGIAVRQDRAQIARGQRRAAAGFNRAVRSRATARAPSAAFTAVAEKAMSASWLASTAKLHLSWRGPSDSRASFFVCWWLVPLKWYFGFLSSYISFGILYYFSSGIWIILFSWFYFWRLVNRPQFDVRISSSIINIFGFKIKPNIIYLIFNFI
jgi:hypothetical protein